MYRVYYGMQTKHKHYGSIGRVDYCNCNDIVRKNKMQQLKYSDSAYNKTITIGRKESNGEK